MRHECEEEKVEREEEEEKVEREEEEEEKAGKQSCEVGEACSELY